MSRPSRVAGSLWRDRDFGLFWAGRMISLAGSAVTTVVLPILVYRLTGSALQTALLAGIAILPYLGFGLVAGALADRWDRRRLMIGCDLLNASLLGTIPLAAAFGVLTLFQIYLVAVLSATAFVWFDAANFGALPTLVGRERLVVANSYLWSGETLINILGPSLAGLLAALLGPAPAIGADALSYGLSAASLLLIRRALHRPRPAALAGPIYRQTLADIRSGLRFLWQHDLVRALTLLGFGVSLTGGAVAGLLVVYAVRGLGVPAADACIGLLFTAGAVGALGASLLLPRLVARLPVPRITLVSLLVNPLLLGGMALAPGLAAGLLLYGLWSMSQSLIIMNGIALRQIVTPEPLLGRVNVTARMIAWGGTPFGAALGGLLAEAWPIRVTLLVVGLGVLSSAVVGWLSPLRAAAGIASPPAIGSD